jgi:hypothetical protein
MLMRSPPKERKRVLNTRKVLIRIGGTYIFLLSGSSWYLKIFPWQTYSNWSMSEQYFSFSGCSYD